MQDSSSLSSNHSAGGDSSSDDARIQSFSSTKTSTPATSVMGTTPRRNSKAVIHHDTDDSELSELDEDGHLESKKEELGSHPARKKLNVEDGSDGRSG